MTGAEVEVHQGSSLTLASDQDFWTEKQVAGLRQLGVERATNGDLAVFMHVCQRTGLDPFARQIYMIERQGKQTIQTGIDGFRLVARRAVDVSGETLSIGGSEWCDSAGNWADVWLSEEPPAAARVTVLRDGNVFAATALFREYVQRKRDGDPMAQWATRPAGMLAKCAEALALRKAFPQDLSGVYTDDEIARDRTPGPRRTGGLAAALEEPAAHRTGSGSHGREAVGPGPADVDPEAPSPAPGPTSAGDDPEVSAGGTADVVDSGSSSWPEVPVIKP